MNTDTLPQAYTRIANDYDQMVAGDAWIRQVLWDRYRHLFEPGQHLLDVACGTGIDVVFLAGHGFRVTGLDVSPGMIAQLQAKVEQAGLSERVTARVLDAGNLSALRPVQYDGMLSAFSGLNTVPDLSAFAAEAASLLRPHGRLIVHMTNRFSLWEWMTLIRRGRLAAATRLARVSERVFRIGGTPVRHYLAFPRPTYRQFFAAHFDLDAAYSLGCLRPPSNMTWIPARLVTMLGALERRVRSRWPFVNGGRFFTLEMTRRADR